MQCKTAALPYVSHHILQVNHNRVFSISAVVYVATYCLSFTFRMTLFWSLDGELLKIALIKTNQNKDMNGSFKYITMSGLNQVGILSDHLFYFRNCSFW